MTNTVNQINKELIKLKNSEKAKIFQNFFKTGPGQYGEGDVFLGLNSLQIKNIAKEFYELATLSDLSKLLQSNIHESRVVAVRILVFQYHHSDKNRLEKIFNFYLKHATKINNWDLVDISAPNIVGDYLLDKDRQVLYDLARSHNLWQKRIAIVATLTFIRHNDLADVYKITKLLLKDQHDLIHKACGWMLREAGKRDQKLLEKFLDKYSGQMPRTMLRYAIERFEENLRKSYLKK